MNTNEPILNLESGYAKPLWNGTRPFRPMTLEEVKSAHGHISVMNRQGKVLTAKVNGKCQTWKTRPCDAKLPCKYGMYEYFYIEFVEGYVPDGWPIPVIAI